jgi:hypothetical protein
MNPEMNTIRLLGVVVLIVFVASAVSEQLLASAVGTGSISTILVNITENPTRVRISNLVALVNSLGIILLAGLLYTVFSDQSKMLALVALGWWLAEAITLAISKIGAYALIPLSQKFVQAGAPESSNFQPLADFLYYGVDRQGYELHMLFFCLGGILWYYLLHQSGYLPAAISLWGLAAIILLTIPVLIVLYDRDLTQLLFLGLPYAPFEFVLGVWLIIKGFN